MRDRRTALPLAAIALAVAAGCSNGGNADRFCEQAAALHITDPSLSNPADAKALGPKLREVATQFDQMAENAPEAIRGDMTVLARGTRKAADVYERKLADGTPQADLAAFDEVVADVEGFDEASARVDAYVTQECPSRTSTTTG